MANICMNCNYENQDNAQICQSCGTELTTPSKKKTQRIKQAQDPAILKVISLILIAAIVLCLITFIQYIIGRQPLLVTNNQGNMTSISFTNNWKMWGALFNDIIHFDFTDPGTVYYVCRVLCHIYGCVFYLALTALLSLTTYLVYIKSSKAKLFSMISGAAGLGVIIIGFLLGYFFVVRNAADMQYSRALPQLTALILFPLFVQLPILGLMLPKRENPENKQNNT